MRRIVAALIAALSPLLPVAATPLDGLFARERLWSTSQAEFENLEAAEPFQWTSTLRDSARAGDQELSLFGAPVVEAVSRFQEDRLKEIAVTFYARGDVGDLPKGMFESLIRRLADAITTFTKTKYTVRGKDASSAVKAEGLIWQSPMGNFLLEYSFTREVKSRGIPFRAEFIRLEITSPQRTVSLLASATKSSQARFSGPANVQRDVSTGEVRIANVPMVDQGQKGYCAVACAERVLRYYGVQADANELAQIANSDAERGTSADEMFDALKKVGTRLRVRVRPIEETSVRDLKNLVSDYNRAAKRGDRAPLLADPGPVIYVANLYAAMKPEVLREVRLKNKSDLGRFQRAVQTSVDKGTPLLWSVMLGLVPEPGLPQASGGHMRLIIGYNSKTQEILYSDSWGAGHELKRMTAEDAWMITIGLTSIEPM